MKPKKPTYGQLDKVLRNLGFSYRLDRSKPPARVYLHEATGAYIMVPPYPKKNQLLPHHYVATRFILDQFGIADPDVFETELQSAG